MALPPLAVAVAPNGAYRSKADHPALPLTVEEIAREAARCAERGASMIHLHVRDALGRHCLETELYRSAIAAIRREVGAELIIQATTEAVGRYSPSEQMALIRELRPQAASLALSELIPDMTTEVEAAGFYRWAVGAGIGVQHILYRAAEAKRLVALTGRGLLSETRPHGLFVLGRHASGQQGDPCALIEFLTVWPPEFPWSLCAFGQTETAAMAAAAGLGGHVRVGFENSLQRPDGSPARSNAEAVERIVALARSICRPLASPSQARSIYGVRD